MSPAAFRRRSVPSLLALMIAASPGGAAAQETPAPTPSPAPGAAGPGEVVALQSFAIPLPEGEVGNLRVAWAEGVVATLDPGTGEGTDPGAESHRRWSRRFVDPGFPERSVTLVGAPVALFSDEGTLAMGPAKDAGKRKGPPEDRSRDLLAALGSEFALITSGGGVFTAIYRVSETLVVGTESLAVDMLPSALVPVPGTRRFLVGGLAGDLAIVEVPTKERSAPVLVVRREKMLGYPPVDALAVSTDGKVCAVSHGVHARVKLFGLKPGGADLESQFAFFKEASPVLSMAFDAEGKRLVCGHADGTVRTFVVPARDPDGSDDMKAVASWSTGDRAVRALTILKGGDVVTGDDSGRVARWTGTTGKAAWEYRPPAPEPEPKGGK